MQIRKAVITGAGRGIGAAAVAALAKNNYRVACLDLDEAAAIATAERAGPGHIAIGVDVSNESAVRAAFDRIEGEFGSIDGLSTAAGVLDATPFLEVSTETFSRVYAVNVIGTFLCMREAVRLMQKGARICTIGSISPLRGGGFFGTAAYVASKGAVISLSKNAARALADRGIIVNVLCPGGVLTPMTSSERAGSARKAPLPLIGREAEAEEIGNAIAWLLSPEASYVNAATIVVDGGMAML